MSTEREAGGGELSREAVDRLEGPVLLEFGTSWCGYCRAAAPLVARLLENYPSVRHIKVEDGPGKPLGRSFRVKLWPTFVFLREGAEVARAVRPETAEVRKGLQAIAGDAETDQPVKP